MTFLAGALLAALGVAAAPNVLLISVDTLRADHLGCYGYAANTSPNIDALAREALLFEDCTCEVPLTTPSFAALFSSSYPRVSGVTRNGLRMPDSMPLMTEQFKKAGYYTACVQSNWPLKGRLCNLDRGFDVYEDDFRQKRWGFMLPERPANQVTDLAFKLLASRDASKPFFFWVHYSDPHAPYVFHNEFNPSGKKLWLLNRDDRIKAKYDSEIAYTDAQIARLLTQIPRENTIIVFTSDHGESLYEHGYLGHGRRIYQDNLHIPLFFVKPGMTPQRSNAPACMLDLAPTLLAMAGVDPMPVALGIDLVNAPPPADRVRHIETYGGAVPKIPGVKLLMAERHPMRQGLLCNGWKFILGGGGPEVYYLPDDPGEKKNLSSQQQDRTQELIKRVVQWTQKHPRVQGERAVLSSEDTEALKSLGYLQ